MYPKTWAYRSEIDGSQLKEQLFAQYYDKIFHYCYSILRNLHDAEDATQEIFMKVVESTDLSNIENKNAWLYKIAYHHCMNKVKRKKLLQFIPFIETTKVECVQGIEEDLELNAILIHLKPSERAFIVLRIVEDKSFDEIATILSISPSTARKRYERIKEKIRKIIERSALQ
ncbi:MAG: sigma-70 family RNA polymerase sigma factor [Solibacillus sp.]